MIARFAAAGCLLLTSPAIAQLQRHRSNPEDQISRVLLVESTDPVIVQCPRWGAESCFRIVLRINANQSGAVDVGHIRVDRTRGASAFSGTGASCREMEAEGLPDVVTWSNGSLTFRDAPANVSPGHTVSLLLTLGCDAVVIAGDDVTIQFALAVDPTGRGVETARYSLPGLQLAALRGAPRRR
jgi:hypothetical protein